MQPREMFYQSAASGDSSACAVYLQQLYNSSGAKGFASCRSFLLEFARQDENNSVQFLWSILLSAWNDATSPILYVLLMTLEELEKKIHVQPTAPQIRDSLFEKILAALRLENIVDVKVVAKAIGICKFADIPQTYLLEYANHLLKNKDGFTALLKCVEVYPRCPWPYNSFIEQLTANNTWSIAEQLVNVVRESGNLETTRDLQVILVHQALEKSDLKRAHRYVTQFNLHADFPNVENVVREESLEKLCSQKKWSLAINFVGNNAALQVQLFRKLVAAGENTMANKVHDKFQLEIEKAPEDAGTLVEKFVEIPSSVSIELVKTLETVVTMEQYINDIRCHEEIVWMGIDAEWKPVFRKDDHPFASVLQIAVGTKVFILDLIALSESQGVFTILHQLLTDATIIKIGFGFAHDLRVLRHTFPEMNACFRQIQALIEMKDVLHAAFPNYHGKGLSSATSIVLGASLDKTQQVSNWHSRPLSQPQLKYAATDAWCLVHMIREIYANNPTLVVSMQQSVKMNEHEDLKSAQEIAGIVERRRAQFSQEKEIDPVVEYVQSRTPSCGAVKLWPLEHFVVTPDTYLSLNTICLMTQDSAPHVVVLPQSGKVDLALFAQASGCPRRRVRLATAQECIEVFGYIPGSVPPVAHASPVQVWIDLSIMETELPLLAGGGLHHLIECSNSESLKELCGENEVKVAALCKGSSNAAATSDDNKLRFLSDSNLGKVSRWLRMRGVDIVQFDDLDRSKFLDQAITEKRIILTSDRKLAQRRSAAAYFLVSSDDPRKQFPEIIKHFGLSTTGEVSEPRCSRCNCDGFRMVDRETARNAQRIPEETLETISEYWQCQACKKIFWTAWKRFQAMRFQDKQADDSVDDSGDVDGADNREDKA
ncbi:hypothetical protein Ae201684P_000844 [Aphanomyces euteiches]|uniref:3'-5' exonuclease domain-containing protein n=1 Tax=Aphanomyces euteiches TaxID=100861 RepID=A0A6G0XRE3_9STRA|nr:hypothetical protein Ae201684_002309 [Aphanomyces euteiches]KAH9087435.1 hypothetical protein Ae201684P_000844 [Aphanomyces euteiches]